jgi:hypothetical protein
MANVYILKSPRIGKYAPTYSLYRTGEGSGRCEGTGFATLKEVKEFAVKTGHRVVKP